MMHTVELFYEDTVTDAECGITDYTVRPEPPIEYRKQWRTGVRTVNLREWLDTVQCQQRKS